MANRFLAGLIALVFCFIFPPPAAAQDALTPEKKALVRELMKVLTASTDTEALLNQFLEQGLKNSDPAISQELLREIPQQKLSPVEQKRLKSEADEAAQRILVRTRNEFSKRINLGEIFDRVGIEIYGKHFTEEELKELLNLYRSPAVRKFLRLLPQITAEMFPKVEEWITPAFTQLMDELITEEKKRLKTR